MLKRDWSDYPVMQEYDDIPTQERIKEKIKQLNSSSFENYKAIIYRLEEMLRRSESINSKCEDNMKRLSQMMLELKGCIAMARPSVKKNAWFGEEIEGKESKETLEIELKK